MGKAKSLIDSAKKISRAIQAHNERKPRFFIKATVDEVKKLILHHLECTLARDASSATRHDWWLATCYAIRDKVLHRYIKTQTVHHKLNVRRLYYLSLEYLPVLLPLMEPV